MTYKKNNHRLPVMSAVLGLLLCLGLAVPILHAQDTAAGQTSATDQAGEISPTKAAPSITIGGRDVMAVVKTMKTREKFAVPESLKDSISQHYIHRRVAFKAFRHAPQRWNKKALVTVVELSDLACVACMPTLLQVDEQLAELADNINYLHMYSPMPSASAVQLAGFYGKIAQNDGKFWDYRAKLQNVTEPNANTYFKILANMGLNHSAIRQAARRDSRRFYREMDADSQFLQRKKLNSSPAWMVNGILVAADHAIPIEKIQDLVRYEIARLKYEEEERNKP